MKTQGEILAEARELLADEEHWLRDGAYAAGADGHSRNPDDPDAVSFCAVGALARVSGEDTGTAWFWTETLGDCMVAVAGFARGKRCDVSYLNDHVLTHGQLLEAFDCAIKKTEEE